MNFNGTDGNDDLDGTNNADVFRMSQGGSDTVNGKGGSDTFNFGASWDSVDKVNGGDGIDTLNLSGGGSLLIGSNALKSLEIVHLTDNADYNITFQGAGKVFDIVLVDGSDLTSKHELRVDAGNETKRKVILTGGAAGDHLTGGQSDDSLSGGLGVDFIDGEGGRDLIKYDNVEDSTGIRFDHVTFNVSADVFAFNVDVTGVDDIMHHRFDGATGAKFEHNLEKLVDADRLGAHHAVVLDVTLGTWSGHTFLIVDGNGTAGYQQGGADYVIEIIGDHFGSLSTGNFSNVI